ncbi:MAG: hypothetical protein FWH41_10660 [Treponema sp.]|nr:hypothetical protein [Treponema sp.]
MENLGNKANRRKKAETEETAPRWFLVGFIKKSVISAFILSMVIFIIYLYGSIIEPGFSDETIFLLLRLLQYSSILLCAFSLYALGFRVHLLVNHPSRRAVFGLVIYFFTGLLGAFFAVLNTLIFAVTAGNV